MKVEMQKANMQKANMLADNIIDFIKYVQRNHEHKNSFRFHLDKLYQVKLFIEEFKFQILADEWFRINKFDWNEKYTYYLINQFQEGLAIINEYVKNHYDDLFLLSAKLYTLNNLCDSFSRREMVDS